MHKVLLSILFICFFTPVAWGQSQDWEDEKSEEFNRKLDSIQETLDDEFVQEEFDEPPPPPPPPPPSVEPDGYNEEDEVYVEEPAPPTVDEEYYDSGEEYKYEETAADYEPELREIDKNEWRQIKNDKRFKYKKRKPKKKKKKKKKKDRKPLFDGFGNFFNSGIFQILLYLLLAVFLGYIVYLFIKNNNISFKKNVKDEQIIQEDPWEDVQHFEDWELALQKALKDNDYRLATRIYYLHTLHFLDKNQVVKYREDKTNWYFVQKIYGTDLHDDFMELTKSFDYIWYGEYQITQEQFRVLQTQFQNFHARIN